MALIGLAGNGVSGGGGAAVGSPNTWTATQTFSAAIALNASPAATGTGDISLQPGGVANNTLTVHNNASATDGVKITGTNALGGNIAAQGAEANVNLNLSALGSSASVVVTGTNTLGLGTLASADFVIQKSAGGAIFSAGESSGGNAALRVVVDGGNSGQGWAQVAARGDTNTDLRLAPAGTGLVDYRYAVVALGGGAAPTLGTIGGSGPATAAQNSWLQVKINGTSSFLPVWR